MTHAELLRSHANLAIKEGGMYYSGEYLSRIAATAESLEAENAKLRKLVRDMFRDFANADYELKRNHGRTFMAVTRYEPRLRELGVEVE